MESISIEFDPMEMTASLTARENPMLERELAQRVTTSVQEPPFDFISIGMLIIGKCLSFSRICNG